MKLKLSFCIIFSALLLLPAIATADGTTMVLDRVGNVDCDGWSASVTIQWREGIYEGDFDWTVVLMDADDNVLEEQGDAFVLTREVDQPEIVTYEFSGPWEGTYDPQLFQAMGTFHLLAPYPDGIDETTVVFTQTFECDTVANENSSWSTIKSIYR